MPEDRETQFQCFIQTMDELTALFDELIAFENKKLDAIAVNNITLLEQHMTAEQALLLKLRGLDQKRERLQKEMGHGAATYRDMLGACSDREQEALSMRFPALSAKTEELKAAVAATKKYIELHLHGMDILLQRLEQSNGTYSPNGEIASPEPAARFKPTKA